MAGQTEYRVEHVAEAPHGYHVRTMAPGPDSAHLIRVAFPPGRRKKGSGQLVEILHPVGENPSSCKNPSSVFSMAVSMGYPYFRGDGRVAADARTWLSRVTKHADGSGGAIFIGWDSVNRKWVVEKESARNPGGGHEKTGGLHVKYSPVNAAYFLMWHGSVLRIFPTKKEANDEMAYLLRRSKENAREENPGEFYCPRCGERMSAAEILAGKMTKHLAEHRAERQESWEARVRKLEREGLTRSDAQAVVDAEDQKNPFDWREQRELGGSGSLFDSIRHGDRVTFVDRFGKSRTGRAVMRGLSGWVLNMGGAHGTPQVVHEDMVTRVRKSNPGQYDNLVYLAHRWSKTHPECARMLEANLTPQEKIALADLRRRGSNPSEEKLEWARNELRKVLDQVPKTTAANMIKGRDVFPHGRLTQEKIVWSYNTIARVLDHLTEKEALKLLRKTNPDEGQLEEAEDLYKTFHGREPREILEIQESSEARGEYTALGDLVELTFIAPNGDHVLVKFSGDGVRVASSPNGEQLYFLGGNQDISPMLKTFGADDAKDLVDLGDLKQIVYEAAKWQTDFTSQEWKHDLGEESGVRPRGFFDQLKRRIFIAGGNYKVKRPGIVD